MRDALDPSSQALEPAPTNRGTHVVVTAVDVVMGAIAVILAVGLVAAVLVERDVPVVLAAFLGQIVTYYFGRIARN